MKTFTVAGYSTHNNTTKFRVANSMSRVSVLQNAGHTDIDLLTLPTAMTKEVAQQYFESITDSARVLTAPQHLKVQNTVKPTKTTKRVPSEYKAGTDPQEFVNLWFKQAEQRVAALNN